MKNLDTKKIVALVVLLFILIFGGSYLLLKNLLIKKKSTDFALAYNIPASAISAIKVESILDFQELSQGGLSPLFAHEKFESISKMLKSIKDIYGNDMFSAYTKQEWVLSLHASGGSMFDFALMTLENNEFPLKQFQLSNNFSKEEKKYDGAKYLKLKSIASSEVIFTFEEDNFLCFTSGALLMEKVIREKHALDKSLTFKEEFFNDKGTKVAINWKNFEKSFLPVFFKKSLLQNWIFRDLLDVLNGSIEEKNFVSFSGTYNQELSMLALNEGEGNTDSKFAEIVPANTFWASYFPYSKATNFISNYRTLLSRKDSKNLTLSAPEIQSENFFSNYIQDTESATIFQFIDYDGDIAEIVALRRKSEYKDSIYIQEINAVKSRNYFPTHFDNDFKYVLQLKNWIAFAAEEKHLETLKNQYESSKTLEKRKDFKDVSAFYKEKSNLKIYVNLQESGDAFSDVFIKPEFEKFKSNLENSKYYGIMALALRASTGNALLNWGFFPYIESANQIKIVATTKLNSPVSSGPFAFTNHNTNKREWIVQDEQKYLYLLDENLKILWSKPLPESIISDIMTIDKFKNGKFQMIFSDKKSVKILDRNGENAGETSSLSSKNLAVFDYDKNKNFRIIGQNNNLNILNLDTEFKPVQGWMLKKLEGELNSKPTHLKVGDKDLILFSYADSLIFTNRRGERQKEFCRVSEYDPTINLQIIVGKKFEESYIVGVAKDGRILIESFTGAKTYLSISDKVSCFYAKVINEKIMVAMAGGNTVRLMNSDGETIYKVELSSNKAVDFIHFVKKENLYLIAVNQNGKLWMLLSDDTIIDNSDLGTVNLISRVKNNDHLLFIGNGNHLKLIAL